ncbi:MAG: PQQ-binding-like beta-propeller repeat protein [Candidatus Cryptobacteroides sp.]
MKNIIKYVVVLLCAASVLSSCWKDEIVRAGADRRQVSSFTAVAGDEQVTLEWTLPENVAADDFIITYTDENSQTVKVNTGAVYEYLLENLVNDLEYNFSIQAVYGTLVSGKVSAKATPKTTRFELTDLFADAGNTKVTLSWSKPADNVKDYTLTYSGEGVQGKTVTIGKDVTEYVVENLENDINYTFTIVVNYPNGQSFPSTVKAMPLDAVVFWLSQTTAAKNQPITFNFNTVDFPTATDIKWTFPGGEILYGAEVSQGISSTGTQTVVLSANVGGKEKTWNIEVEIREYVVNYSDFGSNGSGFKAVVPVFSPDKKTVYALTYNTNATLFAWDVATGNLKWSYETGQKSYNGLTVNPVNGDIYFGTTTAGNFHCISADGEKKWTFGETASMQTAFPTTNADGTVVYICDNAGNAFALNAATGAKIWSAALGKQGGGILVNGDEILFGLNTGGIASLVWLKASDGTEITKISQTTGMTEISGFAVSADKKYAYYSNKGGGISKVDLTTRTLVVDNMTVGGADMYEPVISPNGDVFVGSKDSKAYCLDANLSAVKWTFDPGIGANNGFNYSHPCSDTNGNFYISSGQIQCGNYILNSEGQVVEQWKYGSDNTDRVMAGTNLCDGVYYTPLFDSGNAASLFIGRYVGGTRYDGHGTDLCGNCIVK